jgi:OOP family OmpA-OmpF porin
MTSRHPLGLLTAAVLCAFPGAALHAQTDESYNYWGAGVGQSRLRIDDQRIRDSLAQQNLTTGAIGHDERHVGYKVFLGHQFNRYFGTELGFFDLGKFGYSAATTPTGTLNSSFRVQGANLGLIGTLPLSENFSLLARVGAQYARTRANVNGSGAVLVSDPRPSDRKTNLKVGLGMQYQMSPAVLLRAEAERFRVSDGVGNHPQVAMYSLSLVFPFGRADSSPRRSMATPMYDSPRVAEAPAPMPPPVVAPPPPAPMAATPPVLRRVSYAAESFFTFDRSELRPEGMRALDTFVGELGNTRYETITVQGHADRLGSSEYNQTLSLARAEAVKAYLVNTGRLDGSRIVTAGRSDSEPVTLPDTCKGAMSAPVIACLQPDRRVNIEVSGAR